MRMQRSVHLPIHRMPCRPLSSTEVITESRDAGFLTVDVQQAGVQCKSAGSIWSAAEGLPRDLRCLPWGTSFVSGTARTGCQLLGTRSGQHLGHKRCRRMKALAFTPWQAASLRIHGQHFKK